MESICGSQKFVFEQVGGRCLSVMHFASFFFWYFKHVTICQSVSRIECVVFRSNGLQKSETTRRCQAVSFAKMISVLWLRLKSTGACERHVEKQRKRSDAAANAMNNARRSPNSWGVQPAELTPGWRLLKSNLSRSGDVLRRGGNLHFLRNAAET